MYSYIYQWLIGLNVLRNFFRRVWLSRHHSFSVFLSMSFQIGVDHLIAFEANRFILSLFEHGSARRQSFLRRRSRARPSTPYLRHWLLPGTLSERPSRNRVERIEVKIDCRGAVSNLRPPASLPLRSKTWRLRPHDHPGGARCKKFYRIGPWSGSWVWIGLRSFFYNAQ